MAVVDSGCIIDPRPGSRIRDFLVSIREGSDMKVNKFAVTTVLALTSAGLWAQGDRGLIVGTVTDATGAAVPRAAVTATHLSTNTGYKTSTTGSGDFTVPSLPVGNYEVRVEITGFKTEVAKDVVVAAGATVRV